jgi:hypothetical protein
MSVMGKIVTRVNIQRASKDAPKILNELKEGGTELWKGNAESHCGYVKYVMARLLALAMRL